MGNAASCGVFPGNAAKFARVLGIVGAAIAAYSIDTDTLLTVLVVAICTSSQ